MSFFETKRTSSTQLANASAMVAGTLLLLPATGFAAPGNQQVGPFKQFKLDNPEMSRRDFKREFRQQRVLDMNAKFNAKQNANNPGVRNHEFGSTLQNNKQDNRMIRLANQSSQLTDSGRILKVNHGVDIDLSSTEQNITLGEKLFKNTDSVTIETGGVQKTFTAGSKVTAAEYIACKQMLVLGKQTVNLDASGRAVGGEVDLSALTSHGDRMKVDDLFIPTNLTAFGDVSRHSTFQVTGDLTNAGSLYVYSSGKNGKGFFKADNITNEDGALISSNLSDATANAHGGSQSPVDLDFVADHTFTNHGLIESSGELNITAGDVINTSINASKPIIKAAGNLNISAPHLVNNGLLQSTNASVQIDAPVGSELVVQNQGGVISALNGSIALRTPGYNEAFNTTLTGGDLLSKTFDVNAGKGTADIKVNELTGQINESGLASHVEASTEILNLGKICLTGDPTYKNNAGSIILNGDITVGEALTIISSKDIYNTTALTITAGTAGKGFPITLVAGAEILSNGTDTSNLPSGNGGVATTISGKSSATGGNINLSTLGGGAVTINARGTDAKANSNGADITMVAYANAANENGRVTLTGSSVNSGGRGTGTNGNVTILAGGADNSALGLRAVQTGTINATGGTGGGGSIKIDCIRPYSDNGDPISFNANGTLNGTTFFTSGSVVQNNAELLVDGNLTANINIYLACGGGGQDSVHLLNGVTVKTLSPNGTVQLRARFAADIDQEAGSLISTTNLDMNTLDGDFGTALKPVITNAKYIKVVGDTGSSDIFIKVIAPVTSIDAKLHNLNLTATGNVISTPGNGIDVSSVNIVSTGGSIGLGNNAPLEVNAFSVQFQAKGDVFAHNIYAGVTNLTGVNKAGGTYSVSSNGKLRDVTGFVLTAPKVELKTATTFFAGFAPTINALTSLTLTSAQDITNTVLNTSNIKTPLMVLNCDNNVGTGQADRFLIGANIGGVKVFSKNAYLLSASTNKKGFNLAGAQTDQFDLVSVGGINVTGDVTSSMGNDIKISAAKGFINVKPSVKLTSHRNLTLQVLDTTATASKSKITIGKNAEILTLAAMAGVGDIKFSIGAPSAPIVGTAPSKGLAYAENGGTVYFGAGGITAKGALNTMYAKGADIIVNNPFKATNISFGGNVKVIADPPVTNTDVVWIGLGKTESSVPTLTLSSNFNTTSMGLTADAAVAHPINTSVSSANSDLTQMFSTRTAQLDSLAPLTLNGLGNPVEEDDSFVTTYGASAGVVISTLCAASELAGAIDAQDNFVPLQIANELRPGHSVIVASQDTELTSAFGKVKLREGSLVLVSKQSTGLSIYNLHDNRKDSVAVELKGVQYCLAPGQHLTIANSKTSDFSSINALEAIGHRSLTSRIIDNGMSIFTSEFSVPNAIDSVSSLRNLTASSNPQLKKVKDRMIKTAAVLMYLSGSQGEFQRYSQPQVTALNLK